MTTIHDFEARRITGQDQRLAEYRGSVVLVVNTASKCGLTPQFTGLEKLYSDLRDQGLVVLGFPCDQFANQEFGADEETAESVSYTHLETGKPIDGVMGRDPSNPGWCVVQSMASSLIASQPEPST